MTLMMLKSKLTNPKQKEFMLHLFAIVIMSFSFSPFNESSAQGVTGEPFNLQIERVDNIRESYKKYAHIDLVYGNPNQDAKGFMVVVEPYPERAWADVLHTKKVPSNNFRVWIEARRSSSNGDGWKRFGLFTSDTQTLQFLDIRRKDKSAFCLFISTDELTERFPDVGEFKLKLNFARSLTAIWPSGTADPVAHPGRVQSWTLYFSQPFLKNEAVWSEDAALYMDENPQKEYYFDEVGDDTGWFFNMSYVGRYNTIRLLNSIRGKGDINDNHYVILAFWKDKAHKIPLNIEYFKHNLWIGGFSNNPEDMQTDRNYVAYPHKGFGDWSLFVPWRAIDYWSREGIKATRDNHICYGYYTLTLSNDGKTSATSDKYHYQGVITLDIGVPEPEPQETKVSPTHNHIWEIYSYKRGAHSIPVGEGCTKEFEEYWVGTRCKICEVGGGGMSISAPIGDRCIRHNMKEIGRNLIDNFRKVGGADNNAIIETKVFDVKYKCQNYCCSYTDERREYDSDTTVVRPPLPPPSAKCPPHDWLYGSAKWGADQIRREKVTLPPYDEDSIDVLLDSVNIEMNRTSAYTYLSKLPVSRQQWLDVNRDNNYLGFLKEDAGLLTGVNYQEVFNFIEKLNRKDFDFKFKITFSLPSADEMRQLLKKKQLNLEMYGVQQITSFYIDSIEIYDGKGRLVPAEKLATAPEGAKVRIMVGCMDMDGQVKMVDVATCSDNTAFYLKAITSEEQAVRTVAQHGKFYGIYSRRCRKCGKVEPVVENLFSNRRYHRPFIRN